MHVLSCIPVPSQVTGLTTGDPSPYNIPVSWDFPGGNVAANKLKRYVLTVNDTSQGANNCVQQITFSVGGTEVSKIT